MSKEAARIERRWMTPEGEVAECPKCNHAGMGLTIPGCGCGEGFETASSWCLWCARDWVERALTWAWGSDVLKCEEEGDDWWGRQ